jgi:hypothetical protein
VILQRGRTHANPYTQLGTLHVKSVWDANLSLVSLRESVADEPNILDVIPQIGIDAAT